MPPKRRKLSLDDSGIEEKRPATENEADIVSFAKPPESSNDQSLDAIEKDNRKLKVKTITDLSAEIKAKDDIKPTRISERLIIKRNRLGDAEEAETQIHVPSQNQTTPRKPKAARQTAKQSTAGKKHKRRPCAQWSIRDQMLFFIGIGEFGKNFEAISNKISYSAKQRGLPLKDKMQVRYFYYRCWAKISKFIHLNDKGVKMKTPELYGLINYGVLKKHVKENDPQFGKCLNELILHGETTYRARNVRSKKTRVGKIRTPICKYLKKINRIEDKQASEVAASQKIPHQITLELTPKNSKAWAKVQGMSQNPRVRFKLTANRTLESVFKYLDKKWKPHRVRLKESFGAKGEFEDELIFYLHPSCKITPVKLIPLEQQKVDVTFTSYRENILPTLKKPKKAKTIKDPEKFNEDKDKPKADSTEEPGVCEKIHSDSGDIISKLKESTDLNSGEQQIFKSCTGTPAPFANLMTAGDSNAASFCHSDVASGIGHTSGQFALADTPSRSKPPTVLLEDDNAMFPDSSSFSPPSLVVETSKPSVIPPSSPSPESSLLSPSVISSPTFNKKKPTKSSKKTVVSEEGNAPLDNCDNNVTVIVSDCSSSPAKVEVPTPAQDLRENLEKEITRITNLTTEGFTLKASNTVTLLHLSLILGRENVIRLEYEWREKRPPKVQLPPLLCQAANQMSNVLRRLCNLATLELTDFITTEKTTDKYKPSNKNVPCSHCGREGSAKSRGKRHSQLERKEGTREIATMTDPMKMDQPSLTQVFQPTSILDTAGRTFVAAPASQATLQITGSDPVFRVPFTPTVKTVPSREEQLRLEEQQRLQLQAKAIMQEGPSPRNRLLKRRTCNPRNRKPPSIVVQRTLLPKVDTGQMVAYIQQSGPQSVTVPMVVEVAPDNLVKIAQPVVNIVTCSTQPKTFSQDQVLDNICQTNDILALAAQTAEINSSTITSPEKNYQTSEFNISGTVEDLNRADLFPLSGIATSSAPSLNQVHTEVANQALNANGDISISDLDISMLSVTGSNLGPDAGDKFLDIVLQNSEQGFSGLISTPKKSTQGMESYHQIFTNITSCDPLVLRTPPPHSGILTYLQSSSIYPSPIKLGLSDQPWYNADSGDISLSSVLGDTSPFKSKEKSEKHSSLSTPSSYATFFEMSTSDVPETGSVIYSKSSMVTDISLSSLLGDSYFKKDNLGGVSPPISSSSEAASNSNSHTEVGFFSDAINTLGPPQLFSEVSQDSFAKLEVDKALQGIVSDRSIDLVSKFEFLAAHISGHQDRELVCAGDKQDKLLGGTGNVENVMKFEGRSTAS